jgi:SnoaL-like domain
MTKSDVVRKLLDALDTGDFDTARELLAADFAVTPHTTGKPMGREEWIDIHRAVHESFPTIRHNPSDFREDGDEVHIQINTTARNDRPVRLQQFGIEELPATGIEIRSPPNPATFTVKDGVVTGVHSELPPGGGLPGMIDEIRRAAAERGGA